MKRRPVGAIVWALAVVAPAAGCGGSSSDDDGAVDAAGSIDGAPACLDTGPVGITLTTDDGVSLIADLYSPGQVGGPAVILLHMVPPTFTKDSYPAAFITPLVEEGFAVLNVNRRGAPGSEGVATEAYTGPNGKLDAKAAYDYLTTEGCATPAAEIAIVGASNGTTTATDFSIYAAGEASVQQPAVMVFMSGGTYTENQHAILDNLDVLDNHPIYFAYPDEEATWNETIAASAPGNWTFTEYAPGDHGTYLFTSNPEIIDHLVDFLVAQLPPG